MVHRRATMADETRQDAPEAQDAATEKEKPTGKPAAKGSGKLWMGTAVGIGSAAIVAALLYSRRRS
jgi:hypothetical protein